MTTDETGAAGGGSACPPPEPLTIVSDGIELAGMLFRPAGPPRGALLVCHGAGSRKENHAVMGEQAAAAGLAALTFDCRGHGESGGVLDARGWRDAVTAGEALLAASGAPWLAARGASMGGCFLLLARRARPELFGALIVLCPADGASLLSGLDRLDSEAAGVTMDARYDTVRLRPFLAGLDLIEVARDMPRVLLAHARDDADVPFAHSERLAAVLAPPTEFIVLEDGGHHGPGRSPEVARATLEWALRYGAATGD